MGEFTGGNTGEKIANQGQGVKDVPDGVKTDVEGVFADGEKNGLPVFKVSKNEFYQNMRYGRKRLRFKNGTPAQQYMAKTKYSKAFWIQNKDDDYIRKIK